jgi:non-specific serine/threonine protein kinase/serine/threonine-protein kinase
VNSDRNNRIAELFRRACELDPEDRAAFLDDACKGDVELRAEVDSLLARDQELGELSPTEPERPGAHDVVPERIAHYRIIRELGHGGMGVVYLAEQEDPIRRQVAVKVIRTGFDSESVIARFGVERQALALMSHSNVARVFDAGTTDEGRPYFVMEYVDGVPITEYCDAHRLSTRDRLTLFAQVCGGVQHAHQKGVIHRDLKPSNVLVTVEEGKPLPKIIDFGLAKATERWLTERTFFTQMGMLVGTPEYMSPEQADLESDDIDTRTDVYSLGVLLYELLVGARPFEAADLRRAALAEMLRRIREDEPSKPSTRLLGDASRESAERRDSDPVSLAREIRGDLDWITMKALEKDRARRYDSPSDLARDVERHLRHEPVLAGPPSAAYRMKKFIGRHRFGVLAATVGVVALIGFAATMAVQARRIASESDRVRQANVELESVVKFQAGMLSGMDTAGIGERLMEDLKRRVAETSRDRGLSDADAEAVVRSFEDAVRSVNATDAALRLIDEEILARAIETLEKQFEEQPLIDARLRGTIGVTYSNLGLHSQAEPRLQHALDTRRRILGTDHPDTLASMHTLTALYFKQGRYDEAETLILEALEGLERVLGDNHWQTLDSMDTLANVYGEQGRYAEGEAIYREIIDKQRHVLGENHTYTLASMNNLAGTLVRQGRYSEAEEIIGKALNVHRREWGEEHPGTLLSLTMLGGVYAAQGRYGEAEPVFRELVTIYSRVLGGEHPRTLGSMANLADTYAKQGRYEEAEALTSRVLRIQRRVLGEEHPYTLIVMSNLGDIYRRQRRFSQAESLLNQALQTRINVLGENHPALRYTYYNLGCLAAARGKREEALNLLREAAERGYAERGILEDADVDLLRSDPEFEAIVTQVTMRIDED